MSDEHGFSTRAIHAGQEADPLTGAVVTPIYQVSTYKQDGIGGFRSGYEYSRSANPTRTALEECLAALEGGSRGFAFASGLAGQDTVARALLVPGDHVVVPNDAYGGTYRYFNKVARPQGIEHSIADTGDLDAVRAAVEPGRTKMVWVETPTNPLLGIADIAGIAAIAHEAGAILVVDNTFATAYLQSPLALGADIVTQSTTKYAGGHSDVVGGAVVTATTSGSPVSRTPRSGSPSTRTRSVGSRAPSTRGSRCVDSRPSRSAWIDTATTPRRSSSSSAATTGCRTCSTPACRRTPTTTSRPAR